MPIYGDDMGFLVVIYRNLKLDTCTLECANLYFSRPDAPWCGPCQQFAPKYAEAAKLLKAEGSNVPLAKVDATVETDLASKYEVKGYPTIKFFQNGDPLDYPGGRSPKDIRDWVNWKTGPFAKMLSTAEEVEQFITSSDAVAIGYLSDFGSKPAKAFIEAVSDIFFIPIGVVIDEGVTKAVNAEQGSIVVYKKVHVCAHS